MLTLPIYLRGSSYYLHTRIGSKQFKKSLGTSDKKIAIVNALRIMEVLSMPFDFDPDKLRTYKIDVKKGIYEADGEEDHHRMLEAIGMIQRQAPVQQRIQEAKEVVVNEPPHHKGITFRGLVNHFFLLKSHLKPATVQAYRTAADEFEKFLKNPHILPVIKSDITLYQEYLANQKNTVRTIDNKIAILRVLFNFAILQGYYSEPNPASNRTLQSKKDKIRGGYEIFTDEEIRKIFTSDFMKKAELGDPDYYWTLFLGLLTGCRISEITSLTKDQFKTVDGVNFIEIVDSKTIAGIRQIPIPASIYEGKIKEFIENKKGPIFKYKLRFGKGSGNAVGKKFKRHLEEVAITRNKLVFHSLRKYVNNYFLNKDISIEVRCQFFGHELDNVNVQIYSKKIPIQKVCNETEAVQVQIMKQAGLFTEE